MKLCSLSGYSPAQHGGPLLPQAPRGPPRTSGNPSGVWARTAAGRPQTGSGVSKMELGSLLKPCSLPSVSPHSSNHPLSGSSPKPQSHPGLLFPSLTSTSVSPLMEDTLQSVSGRELLFSISTAAISSNKLCFETLLPTHLVLPQAFPFTGTKKDSLQVCTARQETWKALQGLLAALQLSLCLPPSAPFPLVFSPPSSPFQKLSWPQICLHFSHLASTHFFRPY